MKNFHLISGLPRSGSTLLCQILNMNPEFEATQTSPILDMLISQQGIFSHNGSFKAVDRMDSYNAFADAQEAFLNAFYNELYPKAGTVFDKNRMWPMHLMKLDEIMDVTEKSEHIPKILWTYRDPVHVVASMESRHRKYPLIQFVEEQQAQFSLGTMEARINHWCGDNGIIAAPVFALNDANEMLFEDRIMMVDYKELCKDTQTVMDHIHEFLGLEKYQYDSKNFADLKQTTKEHDNLYNYKYPHNILEGKIEYKEPEFELSQRFTKMINERFAWVNDWAKKQRNKNKKNPGRSQKKKEKDSTLKKVS